jgi:hypothetical protein
MRSSNWLFNFFHVKEKKSGLGGVGLNGFGGELSGFNLVPIPFADRALYFFLWNGNRNRMRIGARIRKAAEDVIRRTGIEFIPSRGSKRDLNISKGDRLVPVIGDDEEDGQKAVLGEVNGEYLGLVRRVVWVGADSNFV